MFETTITQSHENKSQGWAYRLFNHTAPPSLTLNKNQPGQAHLHALLQQECHPKNTHWTKQLFESSKTALSPGNKLIVIQNKRVVSEFEVHSKCAEVLIGTHALSDIQLTGNKIAPFHAKISCHNDKFQLFDLASEQGTYINGQKVLPQRAIDLTNGTCIRIMDYQIHFEINAHRLKSLPLSNKDFIYSRSTELPPHVNLNCTELCPASTRLLNPSQKIKVWQNGITELLVTDVYNENDQVKTFRLVGVNPLSFSHYLPGQYVTLILDIAGKQVKRCYSMTSSPSRPYTLDITVKRVTGGLVSNWLCDNLKPGDKIKVRGPEGYFTCLKHPKEKLLFLGAGSGVTPLMSMTRWLFDTAANVDLKVLFSFRHSDDIIFRRELELLNHASQTIDIAWTLTGKKKNDLLRSRFKQHIDQPMLNSFANDLQQREIYLCGPKPFMDTVTNLLKKLNHPKEKLHRESFGFAQTNLTKTENYPHKTVDTASLKPRKDQNRQPTLHTVKFAKSGIVVQVDESTSLLALAHAEGINIDFSCKSGSCAECMVKCLSGQVIMDNVCEIDDHEREQGWIFSCCSVAGSDLVIDA